MSDQNKNRIAINFGKPSATTSRTKPSRLNPPSALGKRPRTYALGGGSDSEPDDAEDHHWGKHEVITGFGANGATLHSSEKIKHDAKKKDYVIEKIPNQDWKSGIRGHRYSRNLLPEEERARRQQQQASTANVETELADQDKGLQWGLTLKKKDDASQSILTATRAAKEGEVEEHTNHTYDTREYETSLGTRTVDDEAIDALMGKTPSKEALIIQSTTEEDAYRRDVEVAGVASTLEDYEAMPVEEFGAALLRGMGWDGKPRGPQPKEVRRRQNRLGLGAKELKDAEDLGAWNQTGGRKKGSRPPRLDEYRREESRKKDSRRYDDSYKREREREAERSNNDRRRYGDRDRPHDTQRDRDRGYDRDRRR